MVRQRGALDTNQFAQAFGSIVDNVERVVHGKRRSVELAVVCLISGGHALIEDVPGVGKTLLARALAASIDCSWGRIQFTPDLLPSDVTGVMVWNRNRNELEFRPGAVFHHLVLGDEINRASPRTQAALLEAMEERQVTIDGSTYQLDEPFMVLATQNPIEFEGTYPLPEGQLDRFMMRIELGYPDRETELTILDTHVDGGALDELEPVASGADILAMRAVTRTVHTAPALKGYLVDLAADSRDHPALAVGISPRATLAVLRAARTLAAAYGRDYVVPDDVKVLLRPVLEHRLLLTPEAEMEGRTATAVLDDIVRSVPVPTARARAAGG